jgi:glucose-1-phosphate thymidylyltransferase
MSVLIFEDPVVDRLTPITTGCPAYAIPCGTCGLVDLLRELGQPLFGVVRPHLAEIQRQDYPDLGQPPNVFPHPWLLVSGRLVPSRSALETLRKLARRPDPWAVTSGGQLAAAGFPAAMTLPGLDADSLSTALTECGAQAMSEFTDRLPLFEYPHDVVRYHLEILDGQLQAKIAQGHYREACDGVFVGEGVTIGDHVVADTNQGPIVIEANAHIGPLSMLTGPVWIGPGARVNEHSSIKDFTALWKSTKTGGEVTASLIAPYSNKQHAGFLGHSFVGRWVNVGAGTCNSNLKNTYGEIRVSCAGQRVATGMNFLGTIIGDYVKTAINTSIFTGKTVGPCSMLYGTITEDVPAFVNYARQLGSITEVSPEVAITIQDRMFRRRQLTPRPCDVQLIRDMYRLTVPQREGLAVEVPFRE